ncbi:MAG: hypothetical protein QM756_33035 [Polyangiaceae bacterium]
MSSARYPAAVLGNVGRRAVESVIGVFALLGFAYVPLGSKTGLEHSLALARTQPARDAAAGLVTAAARARSKLIETLYPEVRATLPLPIPSGNVVRPQLPRLGGSPSQSR